MEDLFAASSLQDEGGWVFGLGDWMAHAGVFSLWRYDELSWSACQRKLFAAVEMDMAERYRHLIEWVDALDEGACKEQREANCVVFGGWKDFYQRRLAATTSE